MHDKFRNCARQEKPKQAQCELEICPIMPVLHYLQGVSLKIHFSVKIHLMKRLHGYLMPPEILRTVFLLMKVQVVLYRFAGGLSLLIYPRGDRRCDSPEDHQYGERGEHCKENRGPKPSANLPGEVIGYKGEKGEEQVIVESVAASSIGWERAILDRGIL